MYYRLPESHEYVQNELQEMSAQLEVEKRLTGNASASTLWKELVTIPGNRKRAIISVLLMVCQQMTGRYLSLRLIFLANCLKVSTLSTTTPPKSFSLSV